MEHYLSQGEQIEIINDWLRPHFTSYCLSSSARILLILFIVLLIFLVISPRWPFHRRFFTGTHGNYKPIKKIWDGVAAYIFEVRSETEKQHYAQKMLSLKEDGMDDDFARKVLFESRERQSLQHPFILRLKESYNDKN